MLQIVTSFCFPCSKVTFSELQHHIFKYYCQLMQICITDSKNTFDARYLHFYVVYSSCSWCIKALHLHMYDCVLFLCLQSSPNSKVPSILSERWSTYNSRPMAGPFGSTSDTTTVVSPVSGCGLSLPPDMAKPNPSLESCHYERKKIMINRLSDGWKMTASDMNVEKECRRVSRQSVGMCCRCSVAIEGDGAHSSGAQRRDSEEPLGVSLWIPSGVCAVKLRGLKLGPAQTPARPLTITLETILKLPLCHTSRLHFHFCLCSQSAQTKPHWGKDQVVCTSDLLQFLADFVYLFIYLFIFLWKTHQCLHQNPTTTPITHVICWLNNHLLCLVLLYVAPILLAPPCLVSGKKKKKEKKHKQQWWEQIEQISI